MWLGYSPALDLQDEWERYSSKKYGIVKKLIILLIGAADGRHIVKTLAQNYRHRNNLKKKLHFSLQL
jgi:hypothetical protein